MRSSLRELHFDRGLKYFANSCLPVIIRMRTLALVTHRFIESWNIHVRKNLRDHLVQPQIFFSQGSSEQERMKNVSKVL